MTSPQVDAEDTKEMAAFRVFGNALSMDEGDDDYSLTYSMGSENSQINILINKENENGNNMANVSRDTTTPKKLDSWKPKQRKTVSFAVSRKDENTTNRDAQERELFHTHRSPIRPDLVRRTQEAILKATLSVNESILMENENEQEGQQEQKQQQQKESHFSNSRKCFRNGVMNSSHTSESKIQWEEQIKAAREFNERMNDSRLRLLALRKEVSSKGSREKARRQQALYASYIARLEQESKFNSEVFREHQKALKEEEERRRRLSIEARAKVRANAREGKQRMQMKRIDEKMAIIEERHEASVALREKKSGDALARRKSFSFRNGDARRIRELHKLMVEERRQKGHADFLLEQKAKHDMDEHMRQLEQERRKSLAERNSQAAKLRLEEQERHAKQSESEHQSFLLKFDAERDADAFRAQLALERRRSLAKRNEEARRLRQEQHTRMNEQWISEHSSYELKWDAVSDAIEYQRQLQEARRQSLAQRNVESRTYREKQESRRNENMNQEHKSYELEWGGAKDADEYQKLLEKQRRESLAFRNREAHEQRKRAAETKAEEQTAEHASFELKWEADRDAKIFQKKLEAERRQSLADRNSERAKHAILMGELRDLALEEEQEYYALKWKAENDAKEYLAKLEQERRQSLQLRGEHFRHAHKIEEDQKTEELIQQHKDEEIRAEDYKAVKENQAECAERDRKSLEYRGKELLRHRLVEKTQEMQAREIEQKNFELETLARRDVEEYLNECHRRRRMSLATRAKEKRRYVEWERHQRQKEIRERSRQIHGRLMDQRCVELAREEEKAKKALEDILHANRTLNPFSGLL